MTANSKDLLIILLVFIGLLCGVVAIILRGFRSPIQTAFWFGAAATVIGLVSPVLCLALFGNESTPTGWAACAMPLIPGVLALLLPRGEPLQPRGFPLD